VANSASPPTTTIHTAAKGAGTAAKVGPPVSGAREQTANPEFATRSTARRARTIMARKSGISVLPKVTFWLYFRSRSTARGARTIMARKLGIGVLLAVTLRLYFRSSVSGFRIHTASPCPSWG